MRTKDTLTITKRFRTAVEDVIAKNKISGNGAQNIRQFADSIGTTPMTFSKYKNTQAVTLQVLYDVCRKYRINPAWVILGEGEMYLKAEKKKQTLEDRVKRLEKTIVR